MYQAAAPTVLNVAAQPDGRLLILGYNIAFDAVTNPQFQAEQVQLRLESVACCLLFVVVVCCCAACCLLLAACCLLLAACCLLLAACCLLLAACCIVTGASGWFGRARTSSTVNCAPTLKLFRLSYSSLQHLCCASHKRASPLQLLVYKAVPG